VKIHKAASFFASSRQLDFLTSTINLHVAYIRQKALP